MELTDLEIDIFRDKNSGVNDSPKGVRVTHIPSGFSVTCIHRTLNENKSICLKVVDYVLASEAVRDEAGEGSVWGEDE